jgi:hypothetical protein
MNKARPNQRAAGDQEEDCKKLDEFLEVERNACDERRRNVFGTLASAPGIAFSHFRPTTDGWEATSGNWALAFSGGGIRSATFCLGVLQGLARPVGRDAALPPSFARTPDQPPGVLPLFDYLSSVSGGGFTAGFLQSLYAPKSHPPIAGQTPTASQVMKQLEEEPPGRVHSGITPTPLAWLRENGRYLAPSGAGDLFYAIALSIRNWMGLHWVMGVALMFAAALVALVESGSRTWMPDTLRNWWLPPLAVLLLWLVPVASAYWITREAGAPAGAKSLPGATVLGVALGGALAVSPLLFTMEHVWPPQLDLHHRIWRVYAAYCGVVLLLATLYACAARLLGRDADTGAGLAVVLTTWFMRGVQGGAVLLALALVMSITHWLLEQRLSPLLSSASVAGALSALYRVAIKLVPMVQGVRGGRDGVRGGAQRSLGVVLAVLALLLMLAVAVFWCTATFFLTNPCVIAPIGCVATSADVFENAKGVVFLAGLFALAAAIWPSILNMSSYHYFYGARITRAYLGAANPSRTSAPPATPGEQVTKGTAEPDPRDYVSYADYHANPEAPLHLINITLNHTVDPAEQLIQRDRKGQPFVVLPGLRLGGNDIVRFSIGDRYREVDGAGAKVRIGDWLAMSGAAVSTGMGRMTSFGASVCATFANARIGCWWPGQTASDGFWRTLLPTYAYLRDELSGEFYGPHRKYMYLTDGGHFENTATYELLRRVRDESRGVRFILMCDCGADPEYRYKDLANLVRLARIDFQLELEVDHGVARTPSALAGVFGIPDNMGPADRAHLDNRCALLLNVRQDGNLLARIVVIKPRLILCASSDLLAYYRDNPAFPQEPTSDQFFDEEQWESYRKLGLECARTVLGLGPALWRVVLDANPGSSLRHTSR